MNDRIKPIIRRTTLQAILITAAMSCANNPDQLSESTSEILGRTATDPNVIVPDTTFRSVGYFRNIAPGGPFCTGTLISPQVVLTAAHCFAEYAHGCPNGDTNIAQNEFVLSPGGSNTGISTYAIDDIQVAPSSYYPRAANCPSGSVISCSNYGASTGVRRGSDIALVHLTTPVPGSIAQPTPVYTSRENNGGNFVAELANVRHAMLDAAGSIFASRATIPLPTMVGWGNGSTLGTVRRRASAQFESIGVDFHRDCSEFFTCANGPGTSPRPDLSCAYTQLNGAVITNSNQYLVDGIRVTRTSSSPGVWDGPVPTNGDSGSPLTVNINNESVILGVFSGGYQSNPGDTVPANQYIGSRYADTATSENGRFIEQTLVYWASSEFARRANGWSAWSSVGGSLTTAPGASTRGTGQVDAFARGQDNQLWQYFSNSGSSGWSGPLVTGTITSAPAAASWSSNRIDVVARGPNGDVVHTWWTSASGWNAWHSLGGVLPSGTAPTITASGPDHLEIFALGTDFQLYRKTWTTSGGWWPGLTSWNAVSPGTVFSSSPAAVSWSPARIDVFARSSTGALTRLFLDVANVLTPAYGWRSDSWNGAITTSGVGAASWAAGRIDVFGRSAATPTQITRTSFGPRGVASWTNTIPARGDSTLVPTAAAWSPGRLDVFVTAPGPTATLDRIFFPAP